MSESMFPYLSLKSTLMRLIVGGGSNWKFWENPLKFM